MKNLLRKTLVAFVAAVILSLVPGMSAYCGITNFDYAAAAASGSYVQVEGTAIYAESGYPEEKINGAVSGWKLVREGVREKLVEYGCTIFLSVTAQSEPDTNNAGIAHCARISRYTDTGEIVGIVELPYIVCLERSSDLEGVVIHEIRHIFDMTIALMGARGCTRIPIMKSATVRNGRQFTTFTRISWQRLTAARSGTCITPRRDLRSASD